MFFQVSAGTVDLGEIAGEFFRSEFVVQQLGVFGHLRHEPT